MIKIWCVISACVLSLFVYAHPGIGIVKDKKGNIFYTDLKQVWKISPDGKRTVVVPGVHTHELFMDTAGNLFGEHLWYNGEDVDTWGHYVWSLKNDGSIVKVVEPTAGFLENYSFVRDDAGNMYWVERWKISRIKKKAPDGTVTTIAQGKWGDVRWLYATSNGTVYFTNWYNLYKAEPNGTVTLLAADLDRSPGENAHTPDRHDLYGIWTDVSDNVYVAIMSGQMIKKITPGGQVSIVLHTNSPWTPTGGLYDNAGNLWVLENSKTNEVRVRKITAENAAVATKPTKANYIFPFLVAILLLGTMLWAGMRFFRRKKHAGTISRDKKIRAVETALKPLINNL